LNLSSLGIPDFIDKCFKAINEFKETKKKVEKSASHIEEFVRNIEEAKIFKDYDFETRKDPNSSSVLNIPIATEFMTYFDEHMGKVVSECVEKYNMIGDQFLKNIEETVMGN
jgi:dynein heavy chain, axonemal